MSAILIPVDRQSPEVQAEAHSMACAVACAVAGDDAVSPDTVARWLRANLTASQVAEVRSERVLAGDLVSIPEAWPVETVMAAIAIL